MGIGNRERGKLLPSPVTPNDTICIQIEVPNAAEYIAAFFGQLDILGSWYTWEHPTDGTICEECEEAAQLWRTAVDEAWRNRGMCCCDGETPTERFTLNQYMTDTNTFYDDTYNTWNTAGQTVLSIAPNMDRPTGDPANIDKVICSNISIILKTIIDSAIAYKRQSAQDKRDIHKNLANVLAALAAAGGAAIAAGGVLAAGMAFLGGPLTLFGLAMAAVGLTIAAVLDTVDLSVFQDAAAVELVRCTMAQNMAGAQLTRARFMGALSPNHFPSGGNAEKLAAVVQPYLDDINVYLQFLVTANGLYDAVDMGALPDCVDCPPEIRYPQTDGNGIYNGQAAAFIGYDGLYDVWEGPAFDISPNSVVLNGVTYTAGLNIKLISEAPMDILDISGSDWALWVDSGSNILDARHLPDTGGTGVLIGQMNAAAGTMIRFKLKPR